MKFIQILDEKRTLTVSQKHQLKIAKDTLKMSKVGASVAGGMDHEEARKFLKSIGYSDKEIKKLEEDVNEGFRRDKKRTLKEGDLQSITKDQENDIMDIWKVSKSTVKSGKRMDRLTYTLKHFMEKHPKVSKGSAYKHIDRLT